MLRSLFLLPLLFFPLLTAETVDVSATVTKPDDNTYCVSGVCLSIHGGSGPVRYHPLGTYTSTVTAQGKTQTTTSTSLGGISTTTSTSTSLDGSITYTSTTSGGITTTTTTSTGQHERRSTRGDDGEGEEGRGRNRPKPPKEPKPSKAPKPSKPPKHDKHDKDHSGPTIGYGPTKSPGEPGTVIVQKPPTCDVCEPGILVFYMQPTCCPDGSVCDIAGLLSSGPLQLPTDCGDAGSAAITFDACTCTFYCNSTLGRGGAPTQPPTLPPTTVVSTLPPTNGPTDAPTALAPTTLAPTTVAPATQAPTTKAPTTKAPTTAPTTPAPSLPTRANNPTQPSATTKPPSTCSRCNATHVFFVVYPISCTNQLVSTCTSTQIANAAKQLPDNCDEKSITWDGCSCTFYCNTTSAAVPVNPNRPGNAPVLPVPQSEIQTDQVNIKFNITKPDNNTRCIGGTSICITISSASQNSIVTFPVIASAIMGLLAML